MSVGRDGVRLDSSWLDVVGGEFEQAYMAELKAFLVREKQKGRVIYPPGELIFNALNSTPFDRVEVVILGQDPYHGPNQAHGLCFSVRPGVPIPPSLRNIYKELADDLAIQVPNHGYLQAWAERGVLLLNATLTVERGKAGSHQGKGWERFTDAAIGALNERRQNLVFMLWGSYAQRKGEFIDRKQHLVLQAPHPSPFSANRGFFGCRHFSKANEYLQTHGMSPVDWQLSVNNEQCEM
ncbi:MAG: uracil-DNA glycosylase [Cellvibrionaceae bacterium]